MTSQFKKGDIVIGAKRRRDQSFHPIIYFGEIDGNFFEGGMITHSPRDGNVKLEDAHFAKKIDTDPRPSHFVRNYLIKKQEWGPFKKIGKLSDEGIDFVISHLDGTEPQVWEDYTS